MTTHDESRDQGKNGAHTGGRDFDAPTIGDPASADPTFESPGDRVLDAMLHEVVGRDVAPDLTDRVLARLHHAGRHAVGVHWPRRRARLWAVVFGTAVGAAAAALISSALLPLGDRPPQRAVAWQMVAGCLQWQSGAASAMATGSQRALWPIRSGDRLRACEESAAVCDLASLGRLHMTKGTEVEVTDMEWKSFAGGTALGAVTVAVVVGTIRWSGGGGIAQAHTGESLELRAQAPHLAAARVDELTQQVAALQKDLLDEQARARELEARAARTVASNAEVTAATETALAAAPAPLKHAVSYAGMDSVLEKIDWDVTGKCMHEMTMKLDEVFAALEKGEEMPMEALGEVAKLNAELIKQAGELMKAKVPGTGPNGVFTNPIVAANQLHATLAKAGMPLSNAQRDGLQRLSAQIAGEDDARRAAVKDDDFALAGILGETELKDRFYQQARQLLTPQQEQALFPERLQGTAGNLFDSGLVWAQFAKPVTVSGRGEFAGKLTESLAQQIGLADDMTPQLKAAVDTWAKTLPDDAFAVADEKAALGLGRLGPVRETATRQLALLRDLSRTLPLTPEQKRKLRKAGPVFVPSKK